MASLLEADDVTELSLLLYEDTALLPVPVLSFAAVPLIWDTPVLLATASPDLRVSLTVETL